MRFASRNGRLYTGPCPFCADGGDDRFHVWMEASNGRPAERYWCRLCNRHGLLRSLDQEDDWSSVRSKPVRASVCDRQPPRVEPNPAHTPFYRQLYTSTALWAHTWLLDPCHPDPRAYLHGRGLDDDTIFADPRLAALLEQQREAELLQCALRGRPFDHPDVQITLLFSLPVPGLAPTIISEAPQGPESNGGRERAVKE